ncbi:hypothetical protein H634G_03852 [Metarhizium anisopliae BRIP 53293]|uniref:Uncharacterized protein n=1 Tax=Metarhizium anisopliae BRIP 53293 TaxID=1291518 RepID=A0A0D9P3L4_METAN|nr:hypothetical protein H634G_03852 [Metarhizium anisopliae BRIP 53293]KJK93879.1 hypothetical protein H633G_02261 [Metarhizium anisopliae BRIP 53284]
MTAPRASEDIADRTTTGLSGVTVGSYGMGAARDTLTPVAEEGQTPAALKELPSKDDLRDNYGPLSVAFLANLDKSFGFTLAHHGAAYLTQHHLDRKIDRVFRQIVYSIRTTSSYPDHLGDQLEDLVCRKYKLTHYQRGILQLDTPTKAAVGELNTFADERVGADQARYLSRDPKDYAIIGTISKLDLMVGQVATPPIGEKIFKPLLKSLHRSPGMDIRDYPSWPFRILSRTIVTCLLAALFCVPVVIQASGLVSRGGAIAAFAVAVTVGCFIVNVIFQDVKANTMLTLALAALLSNCLKSD